MPIVSGLAQSSLGRIVIVATTATTTPPRRLPLAPKDSECQADGATLPKAVAFVIESHAQAYKQQAFDILGRELNIDMRSKRVYCVAALVVHSATRTHYCAIEYADSGLRTVTTIPRPSPRMEWNFAQWLSLVRLEIMCELYLFQNAKGSLNALFHYGSNGD